MNFQDVAAIAGTIMAAVGGASAIIFALSNWLGKVWADRLMQRETAAHARELEKLRNNLLHEYEIHKVKLKKSEVFFAKELDATSALIALFRGILPRHHMPGMNWHDACDSIAERFHKIEPELDTYLATHGAAIQDDVVALLVACLGIAGDHKFEIDGPEVPASANAAANQLYENLKKAETEMLKHVRDQART